MATCRRISMTAAVKRLAERPQTNPLPTPGFRSHDRIENTWMGTGLEKDALDQGCSDRSRYLGLAAGHWRCERLCR
jgi:hypothetical protein